MSGTGARNQAMGRTAVAAADNSTALFWNPARLGWLDRSDLELDKVSVYGDAATHHAAYLAWPTLELGTFSLGIQRLGVSEIERRDERNFLLGDFGSSETHLSLGIGRRFGAQFAFGTAVRVIQQKVDEAKGMGLGLDLAASWERALDAAAHHHISAGLNLQNLIEPSLRLDEVDVRDPRNLKLGLAYLGRGSSDRFGWVLSGELDLPGRSDSRVGVGAEADLNRTFFLRGGMDAGRPTFGLELQVHGLRFAYALWSDEDLGRKDQFTVGLRFGPSTIERMEREAAERRAEVEHRLDELLATRERQAYEAARRDADAHYESRQWLEASDAYRRVLVLDPDDETARERMEDAERTLALERAARHHTEGDLPLASLVYQTILERWPDDPVALRGLQNVRAEIGRADDRERQLNELFQHAVTLFSQGELLGARSALDELLRIDPDHQMARELRSRAEQMRISQGEESLNTARSAARRGQWALARGSLDEAEALLPERSAQFDSLRKEWDSMQAAQPAQSATTAADASVPSAAGVESGSTRLSAEEQIVLEARFQEGLRSFERGDFDQAIATWQTIWDQAPQFGEVGSYLVKAYLLQGINLYSQGEYQKALSRCRRVLDIDPTNEKARRYLARIEEEQQELEELRGE